MGQPLGNVKTAEVRKWLITALDFIVLWLLLDLVVEAIPNSEKWNEDKQRIFWLVCTFGLAVAEYFFSTIIHKRIVGANDILRRSTMLALTQTLTSYLLLRAMRFLTRVGWHLFFMGIGLLLAIIFMRFIERWILNILRSNGYNTRTVTLVGSGKEIQEVYNKLVSNPSYGYRVCNSYGSIEGLEAEGTVSDFAALVSTSEKLQLGDEVYLCVSQQERSLIEQTAYLCDKRMTKFYYVPLTGETLNLQPQYIDDIVLMTTYSSPLEDPLNRFFKRTADIVISILALLLTALLFPFIMLIIKRQSPGPVFFRQQRTGLDGRSFDCYKFRSMHVNNDSDSLQATKDDPRKFPFGDFMRKTNIDELPQFWNVLRGDMSIVGPRPHMLLHTEQYSQLIRKYMIRHFVKPGVTGWAQVTGFRGETRELWQMEGRVERDIWYIQHWTLWLDLRIIWMTVKTLFVRDKNAY